MQITLVTKNPGTYEWMDGWTDWNGKDGIIYTIGKQIIYIELDEHTHTHIYPKSVRNAHLVNMFVFGY